MKNTIKFLIVALLVVVSQEIYAQPFVVLGRTMTYKVDTDPDNIIGLNVQDNYYESIEAYNVDTGEKYNYLSSRPMGDKWQLMSIYPITITSLAGVPTVGGTETIGDVFIDVTNPTYPSSYVFNGINWVLQSKSQTSPTYTQGSVLFANASGEPTEDNGNFFWDDNNDVLRIGHNSPLIADPAGSTVSNTALAISKNLPDWGIGLHLQMGGTNTYVSDYVLYKGSNGGMESLWIPSGTRSLNHIVRHSTTFPTPFSAGSEYAGQSFFVQNQDNKAELIVNRPAFGFFSGTPSGSSDHSKTVAVLGIDYTNVTNVQNHRGGRYVQFPFYSSALNDYTRFKPTSIAYYNDFGFLLRSTPDQLQVTNPITSTVTDLSVALASINNTPTLYTANGNTGNSLREVTVGAGLDFIDPNYSDNKISMFVDYDNPFPAPDGGDSFLGLIFKEEEETPGLDGFIGMGEDAFVIGVENGAVAIAGNYAKIQGNLETRLSGNDIFVDQGSVSVNKEGVQYIGFGESDADDTGGTANYSDLKNNSLTPKKYVDEAIESNKIVNLQGTGDTTHYYAGVVGDGITYNRIVKTFTINRVIIGNGATLYYDFPSDAWPSQALPLNFLTFRGTMRRNDAVGNWNAGDTVSYLPSSNVGDPFEVTVEWDGTKSQIKVTNNTATNAGFILIVEYLSN